MNLGCSDGNCLFRINAGQATNGGCKCVRNEAMYTDKGWAIPLASAQIMVDKAIMVEREKQINTNKL